MYTSKRVDDDGVGGPTFWILVYVSTCIVEFPRMSRHRHMNTHGGAPQARFFLAYLSVSLTTNPESESVSGLRVLSYLLT